MNFRRTRYRIGLVAAICLVAGCKPPPPPGPPAAPEIAGGLTWYNSAAVTLASLKGKAVVLHFFDYSSAACLRDLDEIGRWHVRYGPSGLVVVGILAPVHEFALNPLNVHAAIKRAAISYPVCLDGDYSIWQRYGGLSVPALVLVDKEGKVRLQRAGAAAHAQEELKLQQLLKEISPSAALPARGQARATVALAELRLGRRDGPLGNEPVSVTNNVALYALPPVRDAGKVYLSGAWKQQDTLLRHARDAEDELSDCLLLPFRGTDVYAVMQPEEIYWKQAFVQQDGQWLDRTYAGPDVNYDEQGRSFLKIDRAGLYHIVANQPLGAHELRVCTRGKGLSVYSFSVGQTLTSPDAGLVGSYKR